MSEPETPQKAPFAVEVTAGQSYFWCACGRSETQPLCDGSHKGSAFTPIRYKAEADGKLWFCGCKRTGAAPLCDGTHKAL